MLNQAVLVGRLVKDPELHETESGNKVTSITLAVPRNFKNVNGEYDTDFISCVLWKGVAENTATYVKKGAKCRYTTIQNWSNDVYNLVTKRAQVEENGIMEWIDGNIGSKTNMKYPSCILTGEGAHGTCISIAVAGRGQVQDAGAKMIHLAPHTTSEIISKSVASSGGNASYRGTVRIGKKAMHSKSTVKCDTILLDDYSKSDTIPKNIVENNSSYLEHEATVSRISKEKLFYLMSRGINEEKAKELLVMGFIDRFREELPMEYAVELNALLKNYF